jgi:hypothetical protein
MTALLHLRTESRTYCRMRNRTDKSVDALHVHSFVRIHFLILRQLPIVEGGIREAPYA